MKHATLIAAAGLIVLANAIALVHAARNRAGEPSAEIVLSDRELSYYDDPDDSGVSLRLHWVDLDSTSYSAVLDGAEEGAPWLDAAKLSELGFDVSVAPTEKRANSFYARQIPRTGFVALEYDGPAWQAWADARRKIGSDRSKPRAANDRSGAADNPHGGASDLPGLGRNVEEELRSSSRLVVINAGSDAVALRARHPDVHKVVIAPAVIGIHLNGGSPAGDGRAARTAYVSGSVKEIPAQVHVPKPFSAGFHGLERSGGEPGASEPRYWVHLRYGSLLEPWVTGVDLDPKSAPR